MSNQQDWTPVVLSKSNNRPKKAEMTAAQLAQAKRTGLVATELAAGENKSAHAATGANLKKLEESTEEFKHNTVDRSLSQAIQQARIAKKLTQKQLATAINERVQVIAQYESGQAIPNPQILSKLDRALGIHLPRGKK